MKTMPFWLSSAALFVVLHLPQYTVQAAQPLTPTTRKAVAHTQVELFGAMDRGDVDVQFNLSAMQEFFSGSTHDRCHMHQGDGERIVMNHERGIRLATDEPENEEQPLACKRGQIGSTHRARKLLPNVFMIGTLLLVLAGVFFFSFSRVDTRRTQGGPIAQAAHSQIVTVSARELYHEIKTVGRLDFGDGQRVQVASPIAGRIARAFVHAPGHRVIEGEGLFSIESDALLARKEALFEAMKTRESSERNNGLLEARSGKDTLWLARRELILFGVSPDQIVRIERSTELDDQLTVESRTTGIMVEMKVHEGQWVKQGDILCQVVQPDPMWLYFQLPAGDLPWVSLGRVVHVTLGTATTDPRRALITAISPSVDPVTQTVRIGVPLPNPDGKLEQHMPVTAEIRVSTDSYGMPEQTGLEGKFICPNHPDPVRDAPGNCPNDGQLLASISVNPLRHERGRALAMPVAAVLDREGHKLVRRLTPTGQLEMREIRVGPISQSLDDRGNESSYYPVRAGLTEGDNVLVGPCEQHNLNNRFASLQR